MNKKLTNTVRYNVFLTGLEILLPMVSCDPQIQISKN